MRFNERYTEDDDGNGRQGVAEELRLGDCVICFVRSDLSRTQVEGLRPRIYKELIMASGELVSCEGCGRDTRSKSRLCSRCTGCGSPDFSGLKDRSSPSIEDARRNAIRELAQRSIEDGWAYDDRDE